jgi:hypothetical protein
MSPNQLRDIVLPRPLLQVTGVAGLANNEIHFDVTEVLKAIVGPHVHPVLLVISCSKLTGRKTLPAGIKLFRTRGIWT